jgi:hypothetical protein
MSLKTNFWVLRQNYGEKTNQEQMKELILRQKFVACPWGGWGPERQNVIDGIYNKQVVRPGGRTSNNQDKRFVEEMKIGDIILIPFAKKRGCIVARITSGVEYSIDTGLFWTEHENTIAIAEHGTLPFRPVGRRIEIIRDDFLPNGNLNIMTLTKMNATLIENLHNNV